MANVALSPYLYDRSSPSPSVGEELTLLLGKGWRRDKVWEWPPDLFAACAWLLEGSGGYVRVLEQWPPGKRSLDAWQRGVERSANALLLTAARRALGLSPSRLSIRRVVELWRLVGSKHWVDVNDITNHPALAAALVELVAIADASCVGFGIPPVPGRLDDFAYPWLYERVQLMLMLNGTLSPRIATTRLVVLPKQHTPQSGITLRSLSHNLALFTGGEVRPAWSVQEIERGDQLNLLVVPWPFEVRPSQFEESRKSDSRHADGYKCFDFHTAGSRECANSNAAHKLFSNWVSDLVGAAERTVGSMHGIIFPEAALTPDIFGLVEDVAVRHRLFVIAGVATAGKSVGDGNGRQKNEVWMSFGRSRKRRDRVLRQGKHHRWQLDRSQLEMYGLAGNLDPRFKWWENMSVGARDVNFVSLHAHMTVCALVCEDLARQDPVSSLVRAVGPNLVIALLSDGPQLQTRWPARYATVLADDPGSSVLTVTNLGMTQLAEPPAGKERRRTVILWKDAVGGQREIDLCEGSSAIVLNLWTRCATEWTADGRSDNGMAAFPALGGVHQVQVDAKPPVLW